MVRRKRFDPSYVDRCKGEDQYFGGTIKEKLKQGVPLYLDIQKGERIVLPYGHIEDDPVIERMTKGRFRDRMLSVITPGMRVLELGCGPGGLSLEMARRGAVVDAHDISAETLAVAREYYHKQVVAGSVTFHHSDVNALRLSKNEYDVVVCWEALHHFAELDHVLNEVHKCLKLGGRFMFFEHVNLGRVGRFVLGVLYPFLPLHIVPTPYSMRLQKIASIVSFRLIPRPLMSSSLTEPPFEDVSVKKVIPLSRAIFTDIAIEETLCFSAIILGRMKDTRLKYGLARFLLFFDNLLIRLGAKGQFAYGEVTK